LLLIIQGFQLHFETISSIPTLTSIAKHSTAPLAASPLQLGYQKTTELQAGFKCPAGNQPSTADKRRRPVTN